jgi:hypothetical protein
VGLDCGLRFPPLATGSVRLAGTSNFKAKYAGNFPKVAIVDAAPNKEGDGPDRSMADIFFGLLAAQRGHGAKALAVID